MNICPDHMIIVMSLELPVLVNCSIYFCQYTPKVTVRTSFKVSEQGQLL
jgi:hypothetical protein